MKNTIYLLVASAMLVACDAKESSKKENGENQVSEEYQQVDEEKITSVPADTTIEEPPGFKVLGKVWGDLTNDGVKEKVVVYNSNATSDFGTVRETWIYTKKEGRWRPMVVSKLAVLESEHGGMMGDPFEEVRIEKGSLVIAHMGGSREKWHYLHRYRYAKGNFNLIGATIASGAPCDFWEDVDYNLNTGKLNYTFEVEKCADQEPMNEGKNESIKKVIRPKKQWTLQNFKPGENQVVLRTEFYTYY